MKKVIFLTLTLLFSLLLVACGNGESKFTTRLLMRDLIPEVSAMRDYDDWIATPDILADAIVLANETLTVEELQAKISTVTVEAAGTVEVTVSDPDPERAKTLSHAIAEAAAAKAQELSTDEFTPPLQVIPD